MGVMIDAVNPANIPAEYDGAEAVHITVLANPGGEVFDYENGNAPADEVAASMQHRSALKKWSIGYVNESMFPALTEAMRALGFGWASATAWPAPGVYLWAADPSGNIAAGIWRPGVVPLAIQRRYFGSTDESDTVPNFPARVAGYIDGAISAWPASAWSRFINVGASPAPAPAPAPVPAPAPAPAPLPKVATVQLPILSQGAEGPSVHAMQTVLGGITADSIFGPVTEARLKAYQASKGLAVDGVVGAHTWGALLGAPQ